MAFVYEIVLRGAPAAAAAVHDWADMAVGRWPHLEGLSALDVYRPMEEAAHDPYNDDRDTPLLMLMLEFETLEQLARATDHQHLRQHLAVALPAGVTATGSAFERRFYPVAGEAAPAPLTATFSYVVRYHRPAEDEAAFVANYVATHPETLGRLPGIRAVICYFPADAPGPVPHGDYLIGNEVVFDHVADFNAAMQSEVRQELRAHFHAFPAFTGRNTHYPMLRIRVTR